MAQRVEARLEVYRGVARLAYRTVGGPPRKARLVPVGAHEGEQGGGSDRGECAEPALSGRGLAGQSARSRRRLAVLIRSMPWERMGARPGMFTFTYPSDWRAWVPDGRTWERQRRAFAERWARQFGERQAGIWAKEFAGRKEPRPHIHQYLAIPDSVSDEDYEGLRQRTLLGQRLERHYGRYGGRSRVPVIGGEYGGEFGEWLRHAWWETVGSGDRSHHGRGVDVRVFFWNDREASERDRIQVAGYLAKESGKWEQKEPPVGFGGVGRYYSWMPGGRDFRPEVLYDTGWDWDLAVAREFERRAARWVRMRLGYRFGRGGAFLDRREGDGLTIDLPYYQVERLYRWSVSAAERKAVGARSERA